MTALGGELGKRERDILRSIVQDYIQRGEPIASQSLLARHDLECSPATVRNVMADLEELGFLEKPHTSAGRIPTQRGYRLFVDSLLKVRQPSPGDRERIGKVTQDSPQLSALLENTVELLHSLSHHTGVVTMPRPSSDPIRQIEFLRLRDNRILAVLVSEAGIVINKGVQLEFPMEPAELEGASNYLNEKLRSTKMSGLREQILADMREDRSALHGVMENALLLAEKAVAAAPSSGDDGQVLVDGEESFLDAPEFADVSKARALLRAFAEKDRVLRVLDKVLSANDLQIFIGAESEHALAPDVSVVAAPYSRGGLVLGTLAVVGPTRMNYARVIPLVDLTAKEITRALSGV